MADFNPLTARRYLEVARRVLGEDLGLSSVSPELSLAKIIDLDPVEDAVHKKVRFWSSGSIPVAANAAGRGTCQIINPANSNLIVVVLLAKIVSAVATTIILGTIDGALIGAGQAPNVGIDTRLTNVAATIPVQSRNAISNTTAVNGIVVDRAAVTIATDGGIPHQGTSLQRALAILAPGHQFNIWDNTINQAATFFVFGYERDGRPEELTLG